eukprot:5547196-Lingulodinium_polyedra.AAC.1
MEPGLEPGQEPGQSKTPKRASGEAVQEPTPPKKPKRVTAEAVQEAGQEPKKPRKQVDLDLAKACKVKNKYHSVVGRANDLLKQIENEPKWI